MTGKAFIRIVASRNLPLEEGRGGVVEQAEEFADGIRGGCYDAFDLLDSSYYKDATLVIEAVQVQSDGTERVIATIDVDEDLKAEGAPKPRCQSKSPSGRDTCTLGEVGHPPYKDGKLANYAHAIPEKGIGWQRLTDPDVTP